MTEACKTESSRTGAEEFPAPGTFLMGTGQSREGTPSLWRHLEDLKTVIFIIGTLS